MAEKYGASLEAWHHWATRLGLAEHLLPVVSNPDAKRSPDSRMKQLGKTPSRFNFRGEVSGIPDWTSKRSTMREIGEWEKQQDYGICVQARQIRAIDIDVPNVGKSAAIVRAIENSLPAHFFPERYREGTGKLLLPYLYEGPLTKRVIPVDGGVIEFLADGQQWIAEGGYIDAKTGKANGRYLWRGGWPADFPLLSPVDHEMLWDTLVVMFAEGDPMIARERREGVGVDQRPRPGLEDPVGQWLLSKWEVREEGRDGEIYIRCPFDNEHTSDSGPTETVYYVAGTGGYSQGHFKCLHAHCMARSDAEYTEAVGYRLEDFPDMTAELGEDGNEIMVIEEERGPRFIVDKQGRKEARDYNFIAFMSDPKLCGRVIAWDEFTANVVWHPASQKPENRRWRAWRDTDYVTMTMQMDRNGFTPTRAAGIRPAVYRVAENNVVDMAIEWAGRLPEWDGVERIERFLPDYLHTDDTEYTRSVGRYMWTAQAGRLLDPGCQADMAPVLVGKQDRRKTTAVRAIAPNADMFVEIDLGAKEDDLSRKMRGVLVGELGELHGLRGKAATATKAFITRLVEKWVPKFQEGTTTFKRRLILYGTTNEEEGFLNDPTGARRWLPFMISVDGQKMEIDRIKADRDQLWAEGIAKWREHGVLYEVAEQLAKDEHQHFTERDVWEPAVERWLVEDDALAGGAPCDRPWEWDVDDVLVAALGKKLALLTHGDKMRVGALLKSLGASKKKTRRGWKYAVDREVLEARFGVRSCSDPFS